MKKRPELRKGSRRVEAWIYSVINPLIEALKVEKSFLKDKNWTWRYETKSLEFIFPLEKYIDSASLPNFEDFLKANPQIERKRKKHEELRAALSENCQIAFNHLVSLKDFQNKISSSLALYQREEPTSEHPRGAVPEKDFHKLIAQYVVNQIKDLPSHYTTSKFWMRFKDKLFEFRIGNEFEKLDASGRQLEDDDDRLLITLQDLRSALSEEYDVPSAPTFTSYDWAR